MRAGSVESAVAEQKKYRPVMQSLKRAFYVR